jgi:hypothetical protein
MSPELDQIGHPKIDLAGDAGQPQRPGPFVSQTAHGAVQAASQTTMINC